MITHVVLFQPKATTSIEELQRAVAQAHELQQKIPGILDVQSGPNLSPNATGFSYGFIMHFVDQAHLQAYAPHPAHVELAHALVALCDKIIDFDLAQS